MRKKKKSKSFLKQHKKYLLILLVLLLILGFGTVNALNKNSFKVNSRVNELAKAQKKDNKDKKTVAWLRVQGTNIDYPVLYAPQYDFSYETDDFAWTEANYKKINNIIYVSGHNIKNQSHSPIITGKNHNRFEQLMSFTYYDFAKENQFIQYTIGDKNYVYKIYSVAYQDGSDMDIFNTDTYSKKDMRILIERTLEKSIFSYGVDVNETDSIISLSTCTKMYDEFDNVHFTVNARLLRDGEKIQLSDVSKTELYDEIENKMKGGDSYDEA